MFCFSSFRQRMIATVLLVAAALAAGPSGAAAQEKPIDVNLAVSSTSFVLGGVRIAQQEDLFAKHGVTLNVSVMDSGNTAIDALISNSVQFAVAGPPDVLVARSRKLDVVIAANLYRGAAGSVVLSKAAVQRIGVKPDAPLPDRLRALKGLTIAVPSATSTQTTPIRAAAKAAGIPLSFTYMPQPAMVAALAAGAIDGMMASSPFSGQPILQGTGVLWINGPGGGFSPDATPASSSCLNTTGRYAQSHADVVRRMQAVMADVATFIKQNPDQAKRDLAKGYPKVDQKSIDLIFSQEAQNWTQPVLTVADIEHEIVLLPNSSSIPGISKMDPASAMVMKP